MQSTREFYEHDFTSTLFPMDTCKVLISKGQQELDAYIQRCLSTADNDEAHQFLAQTRVYASKPRRHLRRTVKLDPVAEYFLYDIAFRNKAKFRKPFQEDKKHFGYRFENGKPLSATSSYTGFKKAVAAYHAKYTFSLSFDIASYFNGVYHHDLVAWFANIGADIDEVNSLGTYLRQTNSGRSIDCWPQGIYPAKMVGNDFLRFVEQHHGVKSPAIVRFMDDFILFSDNQEALAEDFYLVQKLLGQKGLSVNPSKTKVGGVAGADVEVEIDQIKTGLLNKRRMAAIQSYLDDFDAADEAAKMTEEEIEYVRDMLRSEHLNEEDAELTLSIFRENIDDVLPYIGTFSVSYPHLAKNIWSFCRHIEDKDIIGSFLSDAIDSNSLQEYQLFWFAWILQDFLMDTKYAPEIISKLYEHKNSTAISKAKVLEIPSLKYGLVELRDEQLVAGRSDWLAWASAVGHRELLKVSRNHKLEYFANSSQMNHLIKSIVVNL